MDLRALHFNSPTSWVLGKQKKYLRNLSSGSPVFLVLALDVKQARQVPAHTSEEAENNNNYFL